MRLALALTLLTTHLAHADATAVLAGKINVPYGPVPADARVVADCRGDPPVLRTVAVDPQGNFAIEDLPAGSCRVHAEAGDYDPADAAEVALDGGQERRVELALVPQRRWTVGAGWSVTVTRGPEGALPLPARTVGAIRAFGLSFGSAESSEDEYVLDGFVTSDPLIGGLGADVPLLGLAAIAVTSAARGASHAWTPGATIDLVGNSGSNKWDLDALASRLGTSDTTTDAGASWRFPILKDQLWAAATVEGRWSGGESEPRGLARLSWQASARDKVTVTALDTRSATRARLLGVRWEKLVTDNLYVSTQGGWRAQRDGDDEARGWQGRLTVGWFPGSRGEHGFTLDVRHESLEARFGDDPTDLPGQRTLVSLEDSWKPVRSLTVTPGIAYVRGAFTAPTLTLEQRTLSVVGPAPHLGVAWDATQDGRTVVRAAGSGGVDAGSYARTRLSVAPPARDWELSAGAEREVASNLTLAADFVGRWRRGERYRGAMIVFKQRAGRAAYSLAYLRQSTPDAPQAARATFGCILGGGLSVGFTALFGALPRTVPDAEDQGWQIATRIDWSLSPLIGQAISVWLDAFHLLDDRRTTNLQLGLAWSF
jgi:hypothetical protein